MIRNRLMLGGLAALLALAASEAITQEAGTATPVHGTAATPADRSVWDSVYSSAQARRGERVVAQTCSACHSKPADAWGSAFLRGWNDRTVADLFEHINGTMPKDSPGSLSREEYVDVITYIFRLNEIPAGETELGAEDAALRAVKIQFPRP